MKYFILVLVLFLTACFSSQTYEQKLQKWIGQSEYDLFNAWGYPSQTFAIDSSRYVWVYSKTNLTPHQNLYHDSFLYNGWHNPKYGIQQVPNTYYCKTYFTIENATVVNFSFIGDDCY